jgi:hypothetical protein
VPHVGRLARISFLGNCISRSRESKGTCAGHIAEATPGGNST